MQASIKPVLDAMFDRGTLPERVAVMVPNQRARVAVGDVLVWSEEMRAFATPRGDFFVMADYVRLRWLQEFCWAAPVQEVLFA